MTYSTMSIVEIAMGLALEPDFAYPPFDLVPDPRPPQQVLEAVLLGLLERSRVAIAFSGGVDSSGLLCLATHVARQHGLPEPIAVTCRFPASPATDESRWQEIVIAHLGLADWIRLDLSDEGDLLGDAARRGLLAHGVRWPALLHIEEASIKAVPDTIYVMGNGGDELTFPTRTGALQLLLERRLVRNRAAAAAILGDVRPRLRWARPNDTRRVPEWIRPQARHRVRSVLRGHPHIDGFLWRGELSRRTSAPWALRGHANLVRQGAEHGVELVQPLTDRRVICSMLAACGRWGPSDRDTAARHLYGDTMPAEVRSRRDKVDFASVVFGPSSRAFVDQWDGTGLPDDLVDPTIVRAAWNRASPPYSSFALLQHTWLQQQSR